MKIILLNNKQKLVDGKILMLAKNILVIKPDAVISENVR